MGKIHLKDGKPCEYDVKTGKYKEVSKNTKNIPVPTTNNQNAKSSKSELL